MSEISQKNLCELLAQKSCCVHLIGIAGSGMSGLARLFVQRGHQVTGSDLSDASDIAEFRELGIRCFRGHSPEHVLHPDIVCYSSAIPNHNPELLEAQRRGIPLVRRARALAALIPPQRAVIISGTHGKTTTSSMVAHILRHAEKEASYFIGAASSSLGSSAEIGKGMDFVVEADESDGSLVEFKPHSLLILNIESEHLDFYKDLDAIERVFESLAQSAEGSVVYCANDPGASRVGSRIPNSRSYGLCSEAGSAQAPYWRGDRIQFQQGMTSFEAWRGNEPLGKVNLLIPGRHNVSNAVAALAMTLGLGVDFQNAAAALGQFRGAHRRFECLFESDEFLLVDDYAHHPSEIQATMEAARQKERKRLVVAFQPHRYTRTRALYADFGRVLEKADRLFLTDVYAASEPPMEGVDGKLIAGAISECDRKKLTYEPNIWRFKDQIGSDLQKGDLVLIMGAGNIHQVSRMLAAELRVYHDLRQLVSERTVIRRYEPMAKRTTLRAGGFAKLWVEPADEKELSRILKYCHDRRNEESDPVQKRSLGVTFVGRGSNLLVRDAGISGVTIHLGSEAFSRIELNDEKMWVGAGVRLKKVATTAKASNLAGLEFLEGIPGNMGGALWMNAGAMGSSVFDVVERVRLMDMEGRVMEKLPSELGVKYRSCEGLRGHVALSAVLKSKRGVPEEIASRMKQYQEKRWSSQPADPSAGCIFKNPPGTSAGKLIDELGLKQLTFGKARVSEVHGNFIVNDGGASASDVLKLISMIQERVRRERGIELEPEVVVIGDESW